MRLDDARLIDCLDLLLGAAWADGQFADDERETIYGLLGGLAGADTPTAEARQLIDGFDPARLEPTIVCARLGLGPGADPVSMRRRQAFVTLLGQVVEADALLEEGESGYIGEIAAQIGLTRADLEPIDDLGEVAGVLAAPAKRTAQAGQVLGGRYELARARWGGLDARFVAYDRPLGARRVEIRRLNPHVRAADASRLLREAVAVGATGSPHVAAVYDVGGLSDGTPYVVTEPLRGETLRTRLDRLGRLAVDDALRIGDALLAGLEAAHAAGVLHRALSADDVFLVNTVGVEDHVKLTGFGTSRLAHVESEGGRAVIGAGSPIAPERIGGRPLDERADLYSAAALIYEMVTGRPPYGDASPPSLLAVRAVHADRPPRPGDVDEALTPLGPALSPNLHVDPFARMTEAGEMRAALEAAAMKLGV